MQFSDTTTNQGIIQDIDFIVGSNTNTYSLADKTRNINRAMDKIVSLILASDGVWEWDDNNQTDLPVATTSLVPSQSDYAFAVDHLKITKVAIKDTNGNWSVLSPFDLTEEIANSFIVNPTETGTPISYDKRAGSIFLYPAPNYSSSGGLKIYFQRPSTYFTASDTTKAAGFASIFHRYLSLSAAFDFAFAKGLAMVNQIKQEILVMEQDIKDFYGKRNDRDNRSSLQAKRRNYE